MKKIIYSLISLIAISSSVKAVTISVADSSAPLSNPLLSSGGSLLENGSALIRIGYFKGFTTAGQNTALRTALGNLSTKETVYSAIQTSFVPLGEGLDSDLGSIPAAGSQPRLATRTINGVTGQTGRLIGGIANINPNSDAEASFPTGPNPVITGVPAGTRIFMIAYNTLDPNTATEIGIYSATTWTMPSSASASLQLNTTAIDENAEVLHGRIGSLHLGGFVPEPSTSLMALLAGMGLIARRRR